jgi:hypothetical protein
MQDRRWTFLKESNIALDTVTNVATVSLAAITDLLHLESVRVRDAFGEPLPVDWKPLQQLKDMQDRVGVTDTGPPAFWSRDNGALVFWPTPDGPYSLVVDYVAYPGDLAAATDDVIPDALRDLVVWAAVVPLAFRQRDSQSSAGADAHYSKTLLPRAASQDATEQRQTSRQVRAGYWD